MRRLFLLALGAMVVLPLATVDPAVAIMLFDLEFLTVLGSAGVLFLRGDARVLCYAALDTPTMLATRAAIRMTRERPASLLEA